MQNRQTLLDALLSSGRISGDEARALGYVSHHGQVKVFIYSIGGIVSASLSLPKMGQCIVLRTLEVNLDAG